MENEMRNLEYLFAVILSPLWVVCQGIAFVAAVGMVFLPGMTIWGPLLSSANGEITLLDVGIFYLVVIVSVFVANWLHESCLSEKVFKIGGTVWAVGILASLVVASIR